MGQDSSLSDRIADLRQLTADNPVQLHRLDSLSQYIDKNRALLDSAVTMSRSNDFQAAAKLIAAGAIIGYSRRIQSLVDRLESEERLLLDQRRKVNQRAAYALQLVLWVLIVAVAILALVVFKKIRVDLDKEKKSREQLEPGLTRHWRSRSGSRRPIYGGLSKNTGVYSIRAPFRNGSMTRRRCSSWR